MNLIKIRDWILQIALALIIFFGFLKPYVIEAFRIPTPSMEITQLVGDHLLALKVAKGQRIPWTDEMEPLLHNFREGAQGLLMPATGDVETGEIVVFKCPGGDGRDFIKRIVAVAGDTVRVHDDTLFVNGAPSADWPVCHQDMYVQSPLDQAWPECLDDLFNRIQDLEYMLISSGCVVDGDGNVAYVVPEAHVFMMGDNRDHSSDSRVWGPVPEDHIKGEALVTYWSWTPGDGLPKFDRIARMIR